jgi:hypothetical protein
MQVDPPVSLDDLFRSWPCYGVVGSEEYHALANTEATLGSDSTFYYFTRRELLLVSQQLVAPAV